MRLIVLDTNVIVSAGIKLNSIPYQVVEWALDERVRAVTCPSVVREYRHVLGRPKFTRFGFPPSWVEDLIEWSLQLPDPKPWPNLLPDPKDKPFLALAHSACAWLVTGNLKHFPEQVRGGVTVISPAEYLAKLIGEE
jgi:putative PIN family toxin of toxin-antitoxin system